MNENCSYLANPYLWISLLSFYSLESSSSFFVFDTVKPVFSIP